MTSGVGSRERTRSRHGTGWVLGAAGVLAASAASVAIAARQTPPTPATASVADKIYSKPQAEQGEAAYKKTCEKCHALKDGPGPEEGPPLAGSGFLTKWDGKTLHDLAMNIRLNMPPDGSVTIGEEGAADLIAFILKSNGFPDGERPLKADASAKNVVIVKAR